MIDQLQRRGQWDLVRLYPCPGALIPSRWSISAHQLNRCKWRSYARCFVEVGRKDVGSSSTAFRLWLTFDAITALARRGRRSRHHDAPSIAAAKHEFDGEGEKRSECAERQGLCNDCGHAKTGDVVHAPYVRQRCAVRPPACTAGAVQIAPHSPRIIEGSRTRRGSPNRPTLMAGRLGQTQAK